jgi:hypothetical protein
MPNREQMLAGLQLIANRAEVVASLWHILVFMALQSAVLTQSAWCQPPQAFSRPIPRS